MKPSWVIILSAAALVAASFSLAVLEGARLAQGEPISDVQVAAR